VVKTDRLIVQVVQQCPYDNEGKKNMVTQAIKRWLQKMFAWWPWKRSPETDYMHPLSAMQQGASSESILRTTVDGSVSQPGAASIAVGHAGEAAPPESNRSTLEERSGPFVPPSKPEEKRATSLETGPLTSASNAAGADARETPAPTFEQQLSYLRYLVRQGIVNEGFERGKEPEQYKRYGR
jgi:hypothetical protein